MADKYIVTRLTKLDGKTIKPGTELSEKEGKRLASYKAAKPMVDGDKDKYKFVAAKERASKAVVESKSK